MSHTEAHQEGHPVRSRWSLIPPLKWASSRWCHDLQRAISCQEGWWRMRQPSRQRTSVTQWHPFQSRKHTLICVTVEYRMQCLFLLLNKLAVGWTGASNHRFQPVGYQVTFRKNLQYLLTSLILLPRNSTPSISPTKKSLSATES